MISQATIKPSSCLSASFYQKKWKCAQTKRNLNISFWTIGKILCCLRNSADYIFPTKSDKWRFFWKDDMKLILFKNCKFFTFQILIVRTICYHWNVPSLIFHRKFKQHWFFQRQKNYVFTMLFISSLAMVNYGSATLLGKSQLRNNYWFFWAEILQCCSDFKAVNDYF